MKYVTVPFAYAVCKLLEEDLANVILPPLTVA